MALAQTLAAAFYILRKVLRDCPAALSAIKLQLPELQIIAEAIKALPSGWAQAEHWDPDAFEQLQHDFQDLADALQLAEVIAEHAIPCVTQLDWAVTECRQAQWRRRCWRAKKIRTCAASWCGLAYFSAL